MWNPLTGQCIIYTLSSVLRKLHYVLTKRICSTSCLINGGIVTRVTRVVPLVEQEQLTIPEHLSSLPVFSGVRVTRSVVSCVCFVHRFVLFLLTIILSVLLRFRDSDCPWGIFVLFLSRRCGIH